MLIIEIYLEIGYWLLEILASSYSPRYASITSLFARTSLGTPSAKSSPESSTKIWSESSRMSSILCSTRICVLPAARSSFITDTTTLSISGKSPANGSSKRTMSGSIASTRVISRSFRCPYERFLARACFFRLRKMKRTVLLKERAEYGALGQHDKYIVQNRHLLKEPHILKCSR